jgi:hypothetical protein
MKLNFPRCTILRPPLLGRGNDARFIERLFSWAPKLEVKDMARYMVKHALTAEVSQSPVTEFVYKADMLKTKE